MNFDERQKEMADEIKKGLSDRGISQTQFCKSFLQKSYGDTVDELEIEKHHDRFKKVLKLERKLEMIALYYHYYKLEYTHDKTMSDEARNAAYEFYIELDSRIVTQPLSDGLNEAALNSLYQLFQEWREVSKKNGCNSQKFYEHSQNYMNEVLRPFLSKWHEKSNEDMESKSFREELKTLQEKTSEYIESLKHDFNFAFNECG